MPFARVRVYLSCRENRSGGYLGDKFVEVLFSLEPAKRLTSEFKP